MKWFKFYGQDWLSDPKILSLTPCERSCWLTLLCYGSVDDNGMITFLDEQQLMIQAGVSPMHEEWEQTTGILMKLEKLKMIRNDNGVITILNWGKRQEKSLTAYERVKRYRAKHKNDNEDDNAMITLDKNRIDKNRIDNIPFNEFWDLYDKKIGKPKSESKWNNFSLEVQKKILTYLPRYKSATPDKKYRKNPETFFNNKGWEDELVGEKEIKPTHWAGDLALYGDSDIQDKLNKKIIKFNQSTKKYERI